MITLAFTLIISNFCGDELAQLPAKKETMPVDQFIETLRKQRDKELKDLRFEVTSLRRIMDAKRKAAR